MNDTMTDQQIEHDRFLCKLATSPGDGLAHWKRLTQSEQVIVITYMTLAYVATFAGYFLALAKRHARPDLLVTVTNDRDLTPEKLKNRGFRRRGMSGSAEVWSALNGNEVWLIPSWQPVQGHVLRRRARNASFHRGEDRMLNYAK